VWKLLLGRPGRTAPTPVHIKAEDSERWSETSVDDGELCLRRSSEGTPEMKPREVLETAMMNSAL
jgi:hypothetical protein